jgi:hypothetical protein
MSQTFQTLGVSAPLVRALAKHEITTPFAIQELVVPDALAGRDILAQSPTGSGKTLAFGSRSSSARRTAASRPHRARPDTRARDTGRRRHPTARRCKGPACLRVLGGKAVDPRRQASYAHPIATRSAERLLESGSSHPKACARSS